MTGQKFSIRDISVIITCFNDGNYVRDAVRCVLEQTCEDRVLEITVVDDGSGAETRAIVERLPELDERVNVIFQKNSGVSVARNRAIDKATGVYVALLDADDVWTREKLERQMPLFDANPRVGVAYTDLFLVEPDNFDERRLVRCISYQPNSPKALIRYYIDDGPIIPSATIFRREVFDKVGTFNPLLPHGEDNEMCLRTMAQFEAAHLAQPLLLKRFRLDSLGADVETNLPFNERITEEMAEKYPELRAHRGARSARRFAKVGQYQYGNGNRSAARKTYRKVVRKDPTFWKGYVLYLQSCLPPVMAQIAETTLKRIRHR